LDLLFQLNGVMTHWFILLFFKKMHSVLMFFFSLCVCREINPIGKDTVKVIL